jgi:REP element-mobilizing transposase RayT
MRRPPRVDAPGSIHLVTSPTCDRRPILSRDPTATCVARTLLELTDAGEFDLYAWVLMPDHIHLVMQPIDQDLVEAVRRFKSLAWRRCRVEVGMVQRLWQDGFHDRGIRNERALQYAIDYVHMNPVHGRLVEHPEEWEWSSYKSSYKE